MLLAISKSKTAARRAAKDLSVAELKGAIAHLTDVARQMESREQAQLEKKRAADLKKLKAMMNKMGLSAKEVAALAEGKTKAAAAKKPRKKTGKRGPVAPKYKITADGKTVKWTGRGRMPVVFREFVEGGGNLDSCLIKK